MRVAIQPEHAALPRGDQRWERQVRVLLEDLKAVVPVTQERTAEAGFKGGAAEIILSLGTAGAIGAVLEIFRLWLKKDGKRRISVKTKVADVEKIWEITADGLPCKTVERALAEILNDEHPS